MLQAWKSLDSQNNYLTTYLSEDGNLHDQKKTTGTSWPRAFMRLKPSAGVSAMFSFWQLGESFLQPFSRKEVPQGKLSCQIMPTLDFMTVLPCTAELMRSLIQYFPFPHCEQLCSPC
jgi:hypothetical protein